MSALAMVGTPSYGEVHEAFRESFRTFLARHVQPHVEEWEREGIVPRELYRLAGEGGFLGLQVPEEYGGAGVDDFRFNAIIAEEALRIGASGVSVGFTLHNDVCLPYLLEYCDEAQRERWLPGVVSGDIVLAVAMTEPGTGSDLAGIATSAIRDGDHYVVNGAKTFITNGIHADLVITAVKTDPSERHRGLSLVMIEEGTPGFSRGRKLEKIGLHSQDTAELFFQDARVPVENLLGEEGRGFAQLTANLPQERLSIAVAGVANARAAIAWTIDYVREREAFGAPIGALQNTRFVLADCATELAVGQAFLERCMDELERGELSVEAAAAAKLWCTELQGRVTDRCLQLFGGYGYMSEYPIARAYADARVSRIYGGANEIMREILGRSLRLA
ncbi:acyl-CoA dehydrogenase family protein [Patulibacter brassicae]|uniref:Acyl-[acyl-carrier-protein] dehydrogenase MbtN n=1 Tax=Patulibacter brassicae TaxID=1705717 RepID=A0ABU4VJ74_9ACTN|nr:acyl-CoA dehydrogenase family protein [Patulibacter brassicae]MDX8151885.1 acyl-CoA dehydrogenase family protein [Patulibacter brassicae]